MPTIGQISIDPVSAGQSLLLALLFLILAAFPGQLFNKTWEENHEEIARWLTRGGNVAEGIRTALAAFWNRRVGIFVFLAISALVYGFLTPSFGPTAESFASLVGILVGLAVVIGAFELPISLAQRRLLHDRGRMRVLPVTLAVALFCVVASRVVDFQPGYLYGLVAGFAFARELELRDEARAHALTAVWMLAISLVAWLALPFFSQALAAQPLLDICVAAALATIFVAGLEGLLFELVPLRFLRGERVYAWRRSVWAVLFLAAAFVFAFIMLEPNVGYLGTTRVSPLIPAVILFVSFGVVSVLFWAYFRFRPSPGESPPADSIGGALAP